MRRLVIAVGVCLLGGLSAAAVHAAQQETRAAAVRDARGAADDGAARPPATRRSAAERWYHGVAVAEPYAWLEALDSGETHAWVAAQNAFTESRLPPRAERNAFRALLERVRTPPRTDPLRDLVRPERFAGDSTVRLVDEFLHRSPDGRFLAYGLTRRGSDWQELRILDLRTGVDLPDRLTGLRSYMWSSWTHDGAGFFYPRIDSAGAPGERPVERLLYHRAGTPQSQDVLVLDGSGVEQGHVIRQRVSDDGRYLIVFLSRGNSAGNSLYLMDLGDPLRPTVTGRLVPLVTDATGNHTVIGNRGPLFFVATTSGAPRGRVVRIDARAPGAGWQPVVSEGAGTISADFFSNQALLAGDRLVLPVREGVEQRVRFHTLEGEPAGELPLGGGGRAGAIRAADDGSALVYTLASFPKPASEYRYDFATRETTRLEAPTVGFDADAYTTEVRYYRSRDGTRIPLYVTHRTGLERDGSHPTLLLGYGGYGGIVGPAGYASDHRLLNTAWLELGGVVAVAALRGGGEFGQAWHDAGKRELKQNTFDDFIAAAEFLIAESYTRAERLAIAGNSNGGLVVAAALTQRPDLFAAALPDVGLSDMLRAHALPGGATGTHEFGVPDTPESFAYLRAYSPLHNVQNGRCYPASLITTGMNDENVHASHSFKFAAALQAAQACDRPVLLWTDLLAGHRGAVTAEARLDRIAAMLSFLAEQLGMAQARREPPGADSDPGPA